MEALQHLEVELRVCRREEARLQHLQLREAAPVHDARVLPPRAPLSARCELQRHNLVEQNAEPLHIEEEEAVRREGLHGVAENHVPQLRLCKEIAKALQLQDELGQVSFTNFMALGDLLQLRDGEEWPGHCAPDGASDELPLVRDRQCVAKGGRDLDEAGLQLAHANALLETDEDKTLEGAEDAALEVLLQHLPVVLQPLLLHCDRV
mmetsp:Transcript_2585/g.9192  ORF Transcript_2585/g.9192 Transcript_2585/m.9192 type:complete len:207 (+) Transcript_2585:3145-3765(+)